MLLHRMKVGELEAFCYLVGCERTKGGAVIDPGAEARRIAQEIDELGLRIEYILNTHFHEDHTGGNQELASFTGAKIAMHEADIPLYGRSVDLTLHDGDILQIGDLEMRVIHTPGHTPGGVTFAVGNRLFTGDTLFVGDSGRTDMPYGHRPTLGASIRRLMQYPEETRVCPGHDYGPAPTSTLVWERRNNINAREYGFYEAG